MTDVSGKRILLGITGGIAAYKAAELTRLFIKAGADVRVVMTEAACRFITPATLQALSGQPVHTDMWDTRVPDSMGHIELSRDRDIIVVAPATTDFLAKVANGLGDDLTKLHHGLPLRRVKRSITCARSWPNSKLSAHRRISCCH